MDPVSQALLGAAVAEAAFREKLGGKAVVFGALCGLAPDLDIVARAAGPWAALKFHRAETHSLLVLTAVAPLVGWLGWRLTGRVARFRTWWHLAFWALVTHPLLDACTSYGTQLLAPLSRHRFALDAVSIVDPIYTGLLFVAFACAATARVSSRTSRRVAAAALLVSTAYMAAGYALGRAVESAAARQLARAGFPAVRVRASPAPLTFLVWHVVGRSRQGDMRVGRATVWAFDAIRFKAIPRCDDPLVGQALAHEHGRLIRWFSDGFWAARLERTVGGARVYFTDHRYGMPSDPAWTPFQSVAHFDSAGRLQGIERLQRGRLDIRRELALLWALAWNETPSGAGAAGEETE